MLEALSARTDVHVSFPTSRGVRSMRRSGEPSRPLGPRGRRRRRAAAPLRGVPAAGAGAPRAEPVRRRPGPRAARRLDQVPRGRRDARHARARRRRRRWRSSGPASRRRRSRSSARRSIGQARTRGGVRRAGGPVAFEGRAPLRVDAVRPRALSPCCGSRGSTASGRSSTRTFARRTRGCSARTSTGSKDGSAGRGILSGDRAAEVTVQLRDGRPLPPLDLARWPRCLRSPRVRALADAMLRCAHGTSAPPLGRSGAVGPPGARRGRTGARRARDDRGSGHEIGRADVLATLERATVRGDGDRAHPEGSPCST